MEAPAFDVLQFGPPELFSALANDLFGPGEVANHGGAKYLAGYLKDVGARTIVVERDYTDGDYLDDFAAYYVKGFQPYQRRCKRLHFFSSSFSSEQFLEILRGDVPALEVESLRNSYLGFVVARPLPGAIVGRSLLRTYDSDQGRRHYPCTRPYAANLFGLGLSVQSLPFQEQDSVLAACATVSLWCAFHKAAELFGTTTPTPATITRVANQVVHPWRPIPSHGLSVHQICNSIRHAGLEPEVIEVQKNIPLPSFIYGHLRMGLAVILICHIEGIGRHAITLTGYSLLKEQRLAREVARDEKCIPLVGLRINEFYGHDDQIGPFSRIHVRPSTTIGERVFPVVFDGSWIDKTTGKCLAIYPEVVVVPVYHKIRVTFLDVQQWLTRLTPIVELLLGADQALEWDSHLTTTNDFKKALKKGHVSKQLQQSLLLLQHPRFIWSSVLCAKGEPLLELLTDATDMARSFPIYRVIWHHPNLRDAVSALLKAAPMQEMLSQLLTARFFEFLQKSL